MASFLLQQVSDPHSDPGLNLRICEVVGSDRFVGAGFRAKEVMLAKRLFPGKDQVTFFDIWMFTGEILWENLIEPTIQVIY